MVSLKPYYELRSSITQAVTRDLIGPSELEEVINDPPLTRYVSGILYPRRSGNILPDQDNDNTGDSDGEEAVAADPPVALANVRYPSSMGMTFAVDPNISSYIGLRISIARYIQFDEPNEKEGNGNSEPKGKSAETRATRKLWKRVPIDIPIVKVDVKTPYSDFIPLSTSEPLKLFCRVRVADAFGLVPCTVVLLNDNIAPDNSLGDAMAFFQPKIAAAAYDNSSCPFVERPVTASVGSDEDMRSYRLLYRHSREFAAGHGCSVDWIRDSKNSERAREIFTTFAPEFPVPTFTTNPSIESKALEMSYLAHADKVDVIRELLKLCDGYSDWIVSRTNEVDGSTDLDTELQNTARGHLGECSNSLKRIREGIGCLEEENIWRAFRLSNSAMLRQRARTVWLKSGKPTIGPVENSEAKWHPFQLAFILLALKGISDPKSPDRALADLLWFPTGGGKTEAYLGLTAFTIFLRRLRNSNCAGVTALMRYTLRLLTIQQFERAALLICCCESLRREIPELGHDPISIGIWLGKGATPNTLAETRTALNKLSAGAQLNEGNPIQLHSCPWCGAPLDRRNYYIATSNPRLVITCRQNDCAFQKELPVRLIDEDVYNLRPTLIIATVDKFASLPWREKTTSLFNIADGRQSGQIPPELIIQDELHLISGPLGTLVGLYETAIDALCSSNGIRPKIVASTATIRRARQQVAGLFNREIRQFPPPGIDARNSYFAVEASSEEKGNRLYLGLMAPGTSQTTLLVRAYAALLQSVDEISAEDQVKDPYWTLVGYFNSLRLLGGAKLQVQDDVNDRMELLASQNGKPKRNIDTTIELTSREPSSNIPGHLKHMAVSYPSPDALAVILATNMISVGVDIDRLGLMAVMGQPQSSSEYIQSTSRVGRQFPGIVVVLYNSARSRDRSHYEAFTAYHSALYRQVESTSVTPFSARARDRGLHAVIIALARLLHPVFRSNTDATAISMDSTALNRIKETIVARVNALYKRNVADMEDVSACEEQIDQIIDEWKRRAENGSLVYADYRDVTKSLLRDASDTGPDVEDAFPTLWSLRDVDQDSNLFFARIR